MTNRNAKRNARRNIAIRKELHNQVKVKAVIQGIPMIEAVENALEQWLSKDSRHIRLLTEKLGCPPPEERCEGQ